MSNHSVDSVPEEDETDEPTGIKPFDKIKFSRFLIFVTKLTQTTITGS